MDVNNPGGGTGGGGADLTLEAEHFVGADGEPAFENGYKNTGDVFQHLSFYKDPLGIVHVQGTIESGSPESTVFALPTGYRPAGRQGSACLDGTGGEYGRIQWRETGEVFVVSYSTFIYICSVSFRAA